MARPVKFAHVVYMTRRYEAMIAWYRDVFEAEIVNMDPALAFLTYDEALISDDRKHWQDAMDREIQTLEEFGTWKLVDLPAG